MSTSLEASRESDLAVTLVLATGAIDPPPNPNDVIADGVDSLNSNALETLVTNKL